MTSNGEMFANLSVPKMDFHEISALAEEFVLQYYTVMNKCPELLHRFYSDDSVVIYECSPVLGQKKISNVFLELNLKDTRVLIHKVDALRGTKNSVLIQVCGEVSIADAVPRRFMRSFTLCEKTRSNFYVLNDIFRYQDRVFKPEVAENIIEEVKENHPVDFDMSSPVPEINERNLVAETLPKIQKSNGDQIHERTWQSPVVSEPEPLVQMEPEPIIREPTPAMPEPVKEVEPLPEPICEPVRTPSPVQPVINTRISWAQRASGNQLGSAPSRVINIVKHVTPTEVQAAVPHAPVRNAPSTRGNANRQQRGGRPQQTDSTGNMGDTHDQHPRGAPGVGRPSGPPRGGRVGPRSSAPRGAGVSAASGSGVPRRGGK